MGICKKGWFYAGLSFCLHILILLISKGFWVEPDSATFADLAKTQSLSYCTPIGYPVFLWVFGWKANCLFAPVFVQILIRSIVVSLIITYLAQKYSLSNAKTMFLWLVFHIEPQQLYYNTCLMAESLLVSIFLAQWYVWQHYQDTKRNFYLWVICLLAGLGLYLKPIAIVTLVLLGGYAVWKLKSQYKLLTGILLTYTIFYVSVSSLYYWRYKTFEPDIFKGILFWNNASVLTPVLKQESFKVNDEQVNAVLRDMYQREDKEYAFEQDDNRIFEDSSFTQQYIQNQIKQGKTYREAITHTNTLFGSVAKQIVIHYPVHFIQGYILPNTKEWFNALFTPHSIASFVPSNLTYVHTYAQTYSPHFIPDDIHSIMKYILFIFGFAGTAITIKRKNKTLLHRFNLIWIFIGVYIALNIVLHPLEYRYIYPIIAGMQLITVYCIVISFVILSSPIS